MVWCVCLAIVVRGMSIGKPQEVGKTTTRTKKTKPSKQPREGQAGPATCIYFDVTDYMEGRRSKKNLEVTCQMYYITDMSHLAQCRMHVASRS